jgi:anti-sigma B factor antagonist
LVPILPSPPEKPSPALAEGAEPVLEVSPLPDGSGFALAGTLDLATAPRAREALRAAAVPGGELVIDMSRLEFLDSTGLSILVEVLRALGKEGRLILRGPQGIVARILRVSGITGQANLALQES